MSHRSKRLCEALRASLETGKPPRLPAGGDLLWRWFLDLHNARSYGMTGPLPLNYTEIAAYLSVMRIPAEPHHVVTLRAMDNTYLEHKYRNAGKPERRPAGELTADAFDAAFG